MITKSRDVLYFFGPRVHLLVADCQFNDLKS